MNAPNYQTILEWMPHRMGKLTKALAMTCQCPDATALYATVTAMAIAANSRSRRVSFDGGRPGSINQYILHIGESGSGKSAALTRALKAVRERDDKALRHQEAAMLKYTQDHAEWLRELRRLKAVLRRSTGDTDAPDRALQEHEEGKPTKPTLQRILVNDINFNALVDELSRQTTATALVCDEGHALDVAGFFSEPGRFAGLWAGDTVTVDRRTTGTVAALNPRLVVSVAMQPAEFERRLCSGNRSFRNSGLTARFLIFRSVPNFGARDFNRDTTAEEHDLDEIAEWMGKCCNQSASDARAGLPPVVMTFNAEATLLLREYQQRIERNQVPGWPLHGFSDAAGKAFEQIVRTAAAIEHFESGNDIIGIQAVEAAVALVSMSLQAFAELVGLQEDADLSTVRAPRLLEWLQSRLRFPSEQDERLLRAECPRGVCPSNWWNTVLLALESSSWIVVRKRKGHRHISINTYPLIFNASGLVY